MQHIGFSPMLAKLFGVATTRDVLTKLITVSPLKLLTTTSTVKILGISYSHYFRNTSNPIFFQYSKLFTVLEICGIRIFYFRSSGTKLFIPDMGSRIHLSKFAYSKIELSYS